MRALAIAILLAASTANADDVLHVGTPAIDPPTLVHVGITLPITGDDNFTATVAVRYHGPDQIWHDALPLQHAHVEVVQGLTVAPNFSGSIFDLKPDTDYTVELHAVDADGSVDQTLTLTTHTRPVPALDPAHPHTVPVTSAAELGAALAAAQPGDVITLAAGTYNGTFTLNAAGTAADPIVIRGAGDTSILDGGNCTGCNVLELYGSYAHVESLVLQNASRALKFQTPGMTDVVIRRIHIRDVTTAMSSQPNQANFYIEDNVLEGRLVWPCTYASDDTACNGSPVMHGLHANDDGIQVIGTGHVVAHNRISGFGDAMKTESTGAVSVDFYNNDVLWSYDNGIELDGSQRNTRAVRNRFSNVYAPLSFQPIYGGPAYAVRNIIYNCPDEPFKLHSLGGTPTVGAVILHTTVIRGQREIQCSTATAPLYFTLKNSLFVGPVALDPDGHAVRWDVPSVATATIDYNGYFPDGQFEYGYTGAGMTYANLAAAQAAGTFDVHSLLVGDTNGVVGPVDPNVQVAPIMPIPPGGSMAIDRATLLPNIDDGFMGAGPDLGALEAGCAPPLFGPRASGDESTDPLPCDMFFPDDGGFGDDAGHPVADRTGCGCGAAATPDAAVWFGVVVVLGFARRRRRSDGNDLPLRG